MADPRISEPQQFPVYFPGSSAMLDANGDPSGLRGSLATVTIEINLRPQWLTGIRIFNVYDIPAELQNSNGIDTLDKLDGFQTMTTELTRTNIVVRDAIVPGVVGVVGRWGGHWHPLPAPYPWKGGNHVTIHVRRLVSYPAAIKPTVHVVLQGISLIDDRAEARD